MSFDAEEEGADEGYRLVRVQVMCQVVTWPPLAHPPRTWRIM